MVFIFSFLSSILPKKLDFSAGYTYKSGINENTLVLFSIFQLFYFSVLKKKTKSLLKLVVL